MVLRGLNQKENSVSLDQTVPDVSVRYQIKPDTENYYHVKVLRGKVRDDGKKKKQPLTARSVENEPYQRGRLLHEGWQSIFTGCFQTMIYADEILRERLSGGNGRE